MSKVTIREKAIRILNGDGFVVTERRARYWIMTHPRLMGFRYYLGPNGSIRQGRTHTESYDVSREMLKRIAIWDAFQ